MKERGSEVIFGIRAVTEAIRAGIEMEKIFLRKGLRGEGYPELISAIRDRKLPYQVVPAEKIKRITRKNHQGVVAITSLIEYTELERLIPVLYEQGVTPLLILLDGITDVRNFGAIARTAEGAGVHGIILPAKRSAMINADAVKTSSGALFNIPVCRTPDIRKALKYAGESGLQVIAASEKAEKRYFDVDYTLPTLLVIGAEDVGLSSEVLRAADELVRIPMAGKTASLSVSAAAAILVYEVVRRRSAMDQLPPGKQPGKDAATNR